jgi:hypothetical protein
MQVECVYNPSNQEAEAGWLWILGQPGPHSNRLSHTQAHTHAHAHTHTRTHTQTMCVVHHEDVAGGKTQEYDEFPMSQSPWSFEPPQVTDHR